MTVQESAALVDRIWPLLIVQEIARSVDFYRELGFTIVGTAEANQKLFWCRMQRGGACIMLQQATDEDGPAEGRGRGVCLYLVCDDVDAIYRELTDRGLSLDPPSVAYYGMNQLYVPEPNGFSICFESPTEDWTG